jgi:hypothetical protein
MVLGNDITYGITVWRLWKRRNQVIFYEKLFSSQVVLNQVQNLLANKNKTSFAYPHMQRTYSNIEISWNKSTSEWVKCKTNGSVKTTMFKVVCGGVIRDDSGAWLGGVACNLGTCTVLNYE